MKWYFGGFVVLSPAALPLLPQLETIAIGGPTRRLFHISQNLRNRLYQPVRPSILEMNLSDASGPLSSGSDDPLSTRWNFATMVERFPTACIDGSWLYALGPDPCGPGSP